MREIKFRLIKDNKIVGYEWHTMSRDLGMMIFHSENNFKWTSIHGIGRFWIKHDCKDEYTGFHDKNHNGIYAGDIVKHYDYPYLKGSGQSTVEWDDLACGFYPFTEQRADYGHPSTGEWIEVIGNIYEKGV